MAGVDHVVFRDHPTWGALLDNLHVAYDHKRNGIGSRLLRISADAVVDDLPAQGLWLWVHEQNIDGQAFTGLLAASRSSVR